MRIEESGGIFIGAISAFLLALVCSLIFCAAKTVHIRIFKRYNLFEFLVTLIFGLSYVMLQLILSDGIFRLYMLTAFSLGYFIGVKLFNKLLKDKINAILNLFYRLFKKCQKVLMLPAKILEKVIKKEK